VTLPLSPATIFVLSSASSLPLGSGNVAEIWGREGVNDWREELCRLEPEVSLLAWRRRPSGSPILALMLPRNIDGVIDVGKWDIPLIPLL
jgi:hypothetical protein